MQKFDLGQVVATSGIVSYMEDNNISSAELGALIRRHSVGDWGSLDNQDIDANEEALKNGFRLLSTYELSGKKIYIITEADRSYTTVLFPDEY